MTNKYCKKKKKRKKKLLINTCGFKKDVTFVRRDSDVCLYICITRQDVSVGAALGFPSRWGGGQHVDSRQLLLRRLLVSLDPVVDQGHKKQHHAPNHRRYPSQGESYCVVAKVAMKKTCEQIHKRILNIVYSMQ